MIPGLNDAAQETAELCDWVLTELGDDVPLHFTAFHPDYKMLDRPRTPPATIQRARQIALERGIKYAYEGNIVTADGGNTICPGCERTIIQRSWHEVRRCEISQGRCLHCGVEIAGRFD
jgi:pyruvate formate lyase activating enzyme